MYILSIIIYFPEIRRFRMTGPTPCRSAVIQSPAVIHAVIAALLFPSINAYGNNQGYYTNNDNNYYLIDYMIGQ